jgi:hypothetical protein
MAVVSTRLKILLMVYEKYECHRCLPLSAGQVIFTIDPHVAYVRLDVRLDVRLNVRMTHTLTLTRTGLFHDSSARCVNTIECAFEFANERANDGAFGPKIP